jgi:hypothetical protein
VSAPDASPDGAAEIDAVASQDAAVDADAQHESPDADAGGDSADATPPCVPPLDPAPLGPSGYPLDGWGWQSHGVVLESAGAGPNEGFLAPALAERDGVLHLFATRKDGTSHRIWHATSEDAGATWQALAEVSGLGDDPVQAYPTVLVEQGRFRMWVGSGTIDLAESDDGVHWTVTAESVLRPSDVGPWGGLSLLYPSVARVDGGYLMLVTGFDGAGLRIGRATSPDGIAWTAAPLDPVVATGPSSAFDNKATAAPCLVPNGSGLLLWYAGYDTSKTDPGPYRVGLATSDDGLTFTKAGVSLDLPADGPDAYSTRDPAVLHTSDGWLMIYAGLSPDLRYSLLRATSSACAP